MGHIIYEQDRSSAYGDEYDIAIIRFSRNLNRCWRRLVCAKELMHVFDTRQGRTNTRAKFEVLLAELETAPRYEDASPMMKSERDALWRALLILCPEKLHQKHIRPNLDNTQIAAVADILKIPVVAVRALMRPYYQTALESLTGETI